MLTTRIEGSASDISLVPVCGYERHHRMEENAEAEDVLSLGLLGPSKELIRLEIDVVIVDY